MTLIEDSIIAYFDNRLSDAERADLLHQVSNDPAQRQLFQQHEAMRLRMKRAQSNVAVGPHVEDALFAKIATMQPKATPAFLNALPHFPIGACATVLVAVVSTLYLASAGRIFERFSEGTAKRLQHDERALTANVVSPHSSPEGSSKLLSIVQGEASLQSADASSLSPALPVNVLSNVAADEELKTNILSNQLPAKESALVQKQITEVMARQTPTGSISLTSRKPIDSGYEPSFAASHFSPAFEFSIEGTDGSVYPTGMHHLWDFSGGRISAGYFLNASNTVGLRISALSVRAATDIAAQRLAGPGKPDTIPFLTQLAGELYLEHREILLSGRLLVVGSLSGGLINQGNLISAELGLRIPFTDRLQGGVSYSLTRTHSSQGEQYFDFVHNTVETHSPNSVNSRLLYGMSYTF